MIDNIFFLICRLVDLSVAFINIRVMTHYLDPVELGKYALINTTFMFFSMLLINPIGMYINRHCHSWFKDKRLCIVLNKLFFYLVTVSILFMLTAAIYWALFRPSLGMSLAVFGSLVVCLIIFKSSNMTYVPLLNLLGDRRAWLLLTSVSLLLSLFSSILFVHVDHTVTMWLLGQIVGLSIGALIGYLVLRKKIFETKQVTSLSPDDYSAQNLSIRSILTFCLPLAITVGLNWGQFQSYRYIYASIGSVHFLGLFFSGYIVAFGLVGALENTLQQYCYPRFYAGLNAEDTHPVLWLEYAMTTIPLFLIFSCFLFVFHVEVCNFFLSQKYHGVFFPFIIGVIVETSRAIGNVFTMGAHATQETSNLILPQLAGCGFMIVSTLIFSHYFNYEYCPVMLAISALIYLILISKKITSCLSVNLRALVILKHIFLLLPIFIVIQYVSSLHAQSILNNITTLVVAGLCYLGYCYRVFFSEKADHYA